MPLCKGLYGNTLKFGAKYTSKNKKRTTSFFDYDPEEGAVRAGSPVRLHVHVRKQEIKFLNMQERFDRILKGLLPDGEAVLLAVSGGVDSMCTTLPLA